MKGNRNDLRRKENRSLKYKSRAKARASRKLTRFVLSVMVIASLVCIILFSNKNVTSANEAGESVRLTKYYKTITIRNGDSLWSLANQYKSGDYRTTRDYVNELKSMNDLHSENLKAGQKLVVAYFEEE